MEHLIPYFFIFQFSTQIQHELRIYFHRLFDCNNGLKNGEQESKDDVSIKSSGDKRSGGNSV